MTNATKSGLLDRLIREPEIGQIRDGSIRYVMMRPDVLMGAFSRLDPVLRDQALEALAASAEEFGGRSIASYAQYGVPDKQAFLTMLAATAADLGWGGWEVAVDQDQSRFTVTVHNSPFAQAFEIAHQTVSVSTKIKCDEPVCAPIRGILTAVARQLFTLDSTVIETCCAIEAGHEVCCFELVADP